MSTLSRCRLPNVWIVRVPEAGALPFQDERFDAVLIDAPCSGLGTLRRDPDIRWRRTAEDLPRLAEPRSTSWRGPRRSSGAAAR